MKKAYYYIIGIVSNLLFFLIVISSALITSSANALDDLPKVWTIIKVFKKQELIPGVGYRSTVILEANGYQRKAYCLDPEKPVPPVGTQCTLNAKGVYHCQQYQRFALLRELATPTPTPTPTATPAPFDCDQLGVGLYVTYGKKPLSQLPQFTILRSKNPDISFYLDPLVMAPDEIWHKEPIRMVSPKRICGRFIVKGVISDLPIEVVKVEVFIDCPGMHIDLSYEASDGGYCFGCKNIDFSERTCTVTNKLYVQKGDQQFVCQGFYKVVDPLIPSQ